MTDRVSSGQTSFSGHDQRRLATMLKRTSDVRLFRRVQAVLRVAEGDPIRSAARALRLSRRSVHRWVAVYLRRHQPEDLRDEPRAGRPREADELDEAKLAELLAQDPRTLGYRDDLDRTLIDQLSPARVRLPGIGTHAAPPLARGWLALEAPALCLS
jgi:transposase